MEDWKKKIKDSAEEVEIPDSLKPENIGKHLRKNDRSFYRKTTVWAGAAAAAVMLLMAGSWRLGNMQKDHRAEDTAAKQMDEGYEGAVAETAEDSEECIEEAKETAMLNLGEEMKAIDGFYHMSTYEEIEKQVKEAWKNRREEAYYEEESAQEDGGTREGDQNDTAEPPAAGEGAGAEHSTTNLQVEGVDEGDVVKTDGTYLYILGMDSNVDIVKADTLEHMASISPLQVGGTISYVELYVDGTKLILAGNRYESQLEESMEDVYCRHTKKETILVTYDLSDITKPRRIGTVWQDGHYRESRKIGDLIYLFSDYEQFCDYEQREEIDEPVIIPSVNGEKLAEDQIYVPETIEQCRYLVMTSIDTKAPSKIRKQKALMDSGHQFYITKDHIYVLQTDWDGNTQEEGEPQVYTNIVKFSMKEGEIRGEAAASLPGEVMDTFAVNEKDGYLRVLLTDWSGRNVKNSVCVLDERLRVCGKLDNLAPGETIYSARFLGDRGYFVTYRNMDPLFSVDFSDSENPKILGELKITGFSEYLHFYEKDKLFGLGWETDPEDGRRLGLKLSMFDVSDPTKVKEEQKVVLKDIRDCDAMYDYKMVLVDKKKNLIGFPVYYADEESCQEEYLVFSYDSKKGFTKELEHKVATDSYIAYPNTRGVYIGERLYVAEEKKITVFDMKNGFEETGSLELAEKR